MSPSTKRGSLALGRPRDWMLGGFLFAALVLGVHYSVGWGALLAPWRAMGAGMLLGTLTLSVLSYVVRAVRIHDYFYPRFAGRFATVLRLSVFHNVANNLLPMRAGELAFPWLMARYFGEGFGGSLASLIWIRLMDLHFLGLIGFCTLYLREPSGLWPMLGIVWLVLLGLVSFLARMPFAKREGEGRVARLLHTLSATAPVSLARLVRVYLWTALSWSVKFIAFSLVLGHFLSVDLWRVLFGVIGAELSSVLPFHGIAGGGSYELGAVAALLPLGVSLDVALAGAVNLHLFLLGVTLLLGVFAFVLPVHPASVPTNSEP